ncbi:MAG TPA: bifunctional proline dehydrogenase/L-glutamate gamma-semialdehyde dehydrogenase PutA, partial [Crenotrichaceae bacterium]|nr:bifunctional proline dehydrogenase/L-glutamate gamma-semialdehyde dehydrogenase PutA [Crenotrichaceae bacterium]
EPLQQQRVIREISQRVLALARQARAAGVFVTIDAEEAYRLQLSLKIFASVYTNPALAGWHGFGLAVQSYQKSAVSVIDWLAGLSRQYHRTIPLRLVKGAYWDSEIKWAQQQGLVDYPVFTSKFATDVSYLACVRRLFDNGEYFYPQFASHNAHTLSAVMELARQCSDEHEYEFQRLFGMGEPIYNAIVSNSDWEIPCRIYAPVGDYRELLPYLVRRMLENGANSAFVNQFKQTDIALEALIRDPVAECQKQPSVAQRIALPAALYPDRKNSSGVNLGNLHVLQTLERQISELAEQQYNASPLINGQTSAGRRHPVTNPADQRLIVGEAVYADAVQIKQAIDVADSAFQDWRLAVVEQRARCLGNAADLLEEKQLELVSLCMREGGRTVSDALSEVREAVDFCRYYAHSAITRFSIPVDLPGPVGESNRLSYQGRGIFVCISPWNFPIAIFLGQITAALVAGNTVIAKPASATMLTAMRCIQLLHEAGVPQNMLQFVSCSGDQLLQHCLNDPRIAGVAFTGSTDTAQKINQQLARHTKIIPLIAETGGQNVMIADSTALLQQVVVDAIQSAFNSAGQRCSALRVLFIDTQIADQVIEKLVGAMRELIIGDPLQFKTDVGPVINQHAVKTLNQHLQRMQKEAHVWYQCQLAEQLSSGSYFAPCLIELDHMSQLTEEVFGPVLHVIRYSTGSLDQVIRAVNATGYGLTLGIQSRLDKTINTIINKAHVGNVYVNRNMIGAVVGSQPFGGMGLSGTGPKAGGPDYLKRFAIEQTVSINTAAVGGNTELLNNQPLSTIQE